MKKQYMKKRFFHSTIFRIMAIIIVLVLPINIMTLVLSNMVLKSNREQTAKEIQKTLDMSATTLSNTLQNSGRRLIYAGYNESDFLELSFKVHDRSEKGRFLAGVRSELENIQIDYGWIDLMYFHFPLNELTIMTGYPGISQTDCREMILTEVSTRAEEQKQSDLGWKWDYRTVDDMDILFGIGTWNDASFGGIINLERLLSKMSLNDYSKGRSIFFMNMDRTMFSEAGTKYFHAQDKTMEEMEKSNRYGVFVRELPNYDLCLVEIVDWNSENRNLPEIIVFMQWLSIITTCLVIPLLLGFVRRWISNPLNQLTKAMDQIEQGNLDYRIETGGKGQGTEFVQINQNFNNMVEQVKDLKIDVYEKELERKNIQMRYLSQQIQPHFILNAMNILYSYEPEDYPLIQKMILCISKYFRYIVKVNAVFVELHQEMEHIQNYFEIQKARFPELFFAIVEYDEDLKNALVPPLLIQNFAENAIKHSLKIGNNVAIYVVAEKIEDQGETKMRIRMADTGEGISDEILEQIEEFKRTGVPQKKLGVGIQNAIERMKYLYFDLGRLRIWRDEQYSGTNIEIILPVYYAEEGVEYNEDFFDRR